MTKFGCHYASSTTNRGVEAKEVEIANTRLDRNVTESSSSFPGESPATSEAPALDADASGSYVQVVVQKHRRARAAAAAQTSPRLPAASSPLRQTNETSGAGDGNVFLVPASVLLACPPPPPLQPSMTQYKIVCERACGGGGVAADAGDGDGDRRREPDLLQPRPVDAEKNLPKNSAWKILRNDSPQLFDSNENVPDLVEVYYFEQSTGSYLATSGARRAPAVEAARQRLARTAGAWLAELLAALRALLAVPVAVLVGVERAVLATARDALVGGVQTAADYALKPTLALVFNALLQPPLIFCAHVTRGLREVARPLWQLAGDALQPLARTAASLRLVDVRLEACRCRCPARDLV